jgi:Arc/MetJ-type ribon-helix-helix transcriptional regulator
MPTLSIRVDDATKAAVEEAAKAAGYSSYAEFLRSAIQGVLQRTTGIEQAKTDVVQCSTDVERLKLEIELKNEIIAGKEAHIADLQVQVGLLTRLALPPPAAKEAEKVKKHWWQHLRKKT